MQISTLNSWEEFKDELDRLKHEYWRDRVDHLPPLFRGQENSAWSLRTTLDRQREAMSFAEYYHIIHRIKPQVETFTSREWPIPEYPDMLELSTEYDRLFNHFWAGPRKEYPYMAYLRHHGFPSPLLDWSQSAYVAAFFAFHKANEEPGNRVSIYAISEIPNKVYSNDMPLVFRYGPYVSTHKRHFLQQSEYTLCVGFYDGEWKYDKHDAAFEGGRHQQGLCWKFDIPATERSKVLAELNEHNLNAWSLFGSEESMMETLAIREFYFGGISAVNQPSVPKTLNR